jgi:hypothetical protein
VRGAAVAAWAVGLTLAGHAVAAGALPSLPSLVPLAGVSLVVGTVVAGRRISFGRGLAALLLLQPLLHLLLHVLTHPHPPLAAAPTVPVPAVHLDAAMVGAHVLAAVGAAAWLAWADAWLWRVLGRLLPVAAPEQVLPPDLDRAAPACRTPTWRTNDHVGGLRSRGPPRGRCPVPA